MQFSNTLLAFIFTSAGLFGSVHAFRGDATFYDPGLGACGRTNKGSDLVVALNSPKYGNGSRCFKKINVRYNGKSVQATVVDKCPGCGPNDIDLSPAAFSRLANRDLGRIKVDWEFI